jgi:hypothetical protein
MEYPRKRVTSALLILAILAATAGPVIAQEPLAERYLARLSARSKRARTLGGGLGLAMGSFCVAGGLSMMAEDDEEDWFGLGELFGTIGVVAGGVMCAGSVLALSLPSPSERANKRVSTLQDPVMREAACANALADLAKKGHRSRMIGAAVSCGLGIVGAVSASGEDNSNGPLISVAYGGGLALFLFLVKSPAERAYRGYLDKSGVKLVPDLVLGVGPRGGFRAGLSLDF